MAAVAVCQCRRGCGLAPPVKGFGASAARRLLAGGWKLLGTSAGSPEADYC